MLKRIKKTIKLMFFPLAVLFIATSFTGAYFSDSVSVTGNVFSTGRWAGEPAVARVVINEVYYDVSPDKGGDGNVADSGEWIELYNGGTADVNLKDWTISDNTTTRTINAASHTLNPGTYALIAKNNSIWSLYWLIPAGVEVVDLGAVIGGGLANGGDRIILKDNTGALVDQISYGSDMTVFNPAIIDVAEGHSIARNPVGFDTNSASDFIDLAVPTPGS